MTAEVKDRKKASRRRVKMDAHDHKKRGRSEGVIADRKHRPRKVCPHLAAEFYENGQGDLGDEMLRGLRTWAKPIAQMAGRARARSGVSRGR
jgi:hypothetical protein